MSNVELGWYDVVGPVKPRKESVDASLEAAAGVAIDVEAPLKEALSDQLAGYANEAIGGAKLAVGIAAQSPALAMAGIAQAAIGEIQRIVGEGKMVRAPDEAPTAT